MGVNKRGARSENLGPNQMTHNRRAACIPSAHGVRAMQGLVNRVNLDT
nr:MAG TPA: hypothetical protein [Caudoviricetes sp.]